MFVYMTPEAVMPPSLRRGGLGKAISTHLLSSSLSSTYYVPSSFADTV